MLPDSADIVLQNIIPHADSGRLSELVILVPDGHSPGFAGALVSYTLSLHNYTGHMDAFDLAATGNTWPITFWNGGQITNTGTLPDGGGITFTVQVEIPLSASPGDVDMATVRATSVTSPTVYSDTAAIDTTVVCSPALVFTGQSNQARWFDDTYDYGGQKFTYLYLDAHTPSPSNSMNATVQAYDPVLDLWQTLYQDEGLGLERLLVDQIFVPPVYSAVRVQMSDNGGWTQAYYDYRFIVCREPALALSPLTQAHFTRPETTALYTQTVTNYTMDTDNFDLTATGNNWPVTFWNGPTPIDNTGPLADLEAFTFTVRLDVPANAATADADTVIIQANSSASPGISDTTFLDTTVLAGSWVQAFDDRWAPDGSTDSELYLDIMQPGGIVLTQVTDDWSWQDTPLAVAAYPRKAIVAAWTAAYNWNDMADYFDVEYAAFDVNGNTTIPITRISNNAGTTIYTADWNPTLAVAPANGNVLITWYRYENDYAGNSWENVYYAVRAPDGNEILPPTALTDNTTDAGRDDYPSAAAFDDGHFAVAWERWDNSQAVMDIYYAVFDSRGTVIAGPLNLTSNVESYDYEPRANRLADGNVLLTWYGWHAPNSAIYYAVLDSTGNVTHPISQLSDASCQVYDPDAVGLRNGNLVVAWEQYGCDDASLYRQIAYAMLDSTYNILTGPTQLTYTSASDNMYVSLARDGDDNAVLTWCANIHQHIYYALVGNDGAVRTWPTILRTTHGSQIDVNEQGAGNGSFPEPVLAIAKTAAPNPVEAGARLTYTLVAENTGYVAATGVTITDTLPANTTFISAGSGGALAGDQVQWTGLTVSAGGTLAVQFVVHVNEFLAEGAILTNDDYGVKCAQVPTPTMGAAITATVTVRQWRIFVPVVLKESQ